jgi:hypothetical protein
VTAIVSPICLVALAGAAAAATGLRWRLLIAAMLRSRRPDPRFDRIGGRIKASASTSSARGACCAGRTPASSTRLIFWGFLVLFTAIAQAIVEALWQGFRFNDVPAAFVIAFAQDIFCVAVLAGVALALINRLAVNPARFRASHRGDAVLILAWNHLPRFLLPGTLERHLCAAPRHPRADSRAQGGGDGAQSQRAAPNVFFKSTKPRGGCPSSTSRR